MYMEPLEQLLPIPSKPNIDHNATFLLHYAFKVGSDNPHNCGNAHSLIFLKMHLRRFKIPEIPIIYAYTRWKPFF